MIKVVFCLRRQPHLSRQEFQHYWRTVHAPLVAEALEASRELLEDEEKSIDLASSPIFFTRETEVVGPHA